MNEHTARKSEIVSVAFKPRSLDKILPTLENEAGKGGDLLLLPETCLGNDTIVETDGPECSAVARLAERYGVYIVFPVFRRTKQHPRLNSSILVDRQGNVAGIYDKAYPYWSEFQLEPPCAPGTEVPVFSTDFGRVGLAICFDVNFPGVFRLLAECGARLVLWSSAYSAGTSLQAHALNHNYAIVSSTMIPDCAVYDINGAEIFYRRGDEAGVCVNRVWVDLDRCIFHEDFNIAKRDKLLAEHSDEIEMDASFEREQWFTLRSKKDGVSARTLAAKYGMEELSSYKQRSEAAINIRRGNTAPRPQGGQRCSLTR
jgi:predicted amidohydrolase